MGLITKQTFNGKILKAGDIVWFKGDYGTTPAIVYDVSDDGATLLEIYSTKDVDQILIWPQQDSFDIQFDPNATSPEDLQVYHWMWRE
jgi:hypothetical protein